MREDHSATLVAVTPQTAEQNKQLIASRNLDFDVLFDDDNKFALALDLVHGFPDDLKEVYGKFGIDVGMANGNSKWELPIPARFVVDRQGVVRRADFDADYTTRPEPSATLDVIKSLAS